MAEVHRHGPKLLLGASAGLVAAGIFLFVLGHPDDDDLAPSGLTWAQLQESNPELADFMARAYREGALALLGFGLASGLIVWRPFRRGERWAWYTTAAVPALYFAIAAYEAKTSVKLSYGTLGAVALLGWLGSARLFFAGASRGK